MALKVNDVCMVINNTTLSEPHRFKLGELVIIHKYFKDQFYQYWCKNDKIGWMLDKDELYKIGEL